ncbi:cupin domain-containing protein [Actinocrispum wychmicini]|uniref:Cupin domain n=1 Tax=Actinocrispum wychmicini TaxID=1213861 RepID=A0A4R2ISF5_9PSEU|nr:cupin domain-containing protein [Actinocrispum wychmicini]TCO47406.1 cupin domain [Actinocrispum wychmicini]
MSKVFHYRDVTPSQVDTIAVHETHQDDANGLHQAIYRCLPGRSSSRSPGEGRLETLYVLSGTGTLHREDGDHPLRPELASLIVGKDSYEITALEEMVLVSVSADVQPSVECGDYRATVDLADQSTQDAVSQREYQVLFDPAVGCSGVTQFLGYIPTIRTPMHYHPYSEMAFVVGGSGRVEIAGETSTLTPGSCFYLPAGVHHRVENLDTGFLRLLGVFTPAGSPSQNIPVE